MGIVVFPLLLGLVLATGKPSDAALADFSRFSKHVGAEVALVDRAGVVREGVLSAADADTVTVTLAPAAHAFARADVASAERLRDSTSDGIKKGVIFGAVMGVFVMQGFSTPQSGVGGYCATVAIYATIGWAFDRAKTHRQPIYRAPAPTMKVSLRF